MVGLVAKLITNKTVLGISFAIIILLGAVSVYSYQKYLINKSERLIVQQREINTDLSSKLERATSRIESLIDANKELSSKIEIAITRINNLTVQNNKVKETINTIKQEVSDSRLQSLADKKPGLIELKVNKATAEVFETLENETK